MSLVRITVLNPLYPGIKCMMPLYFSHPVPLFYYTFSFHFALFDGFHAGLAGERKYSTATMSGRAILVKNKDFAKKQTLSTNCSS